MRSVPSWPNLPGTRQPRTRPCSGPAASIDHTPPPTHVLSTSEHDQSARVRDDHRMLEPAGDLGHGRNEVGLVDAPGLITLVCVAHRDAAWVTVPLVAETGSGGATECRSRKWLVPAPKPTRWPLFPLDHASCLCGCCNTHTLRPVAYSGSGLPPPGRWPRLPGQRQQRVGASQRSAERLCRCIVPIRGGGEGGRRRWHSRLGRGSRSRRE